MLKKLRAALEKCIDFLIKKSSKIDEKSSPKVRKTLLARKIDKKSLPGALFWAKDRFLVDFGIPEGTQKSPKSYESAVGMGFEARLFRRIHWKWHPDLIFPSFGIKFDTGRARNSRKPVPAGCKRLDAKTSKFYYFNSAFWTQKSTKLVVVCWFCLEFRSEEVSRDVWRVLGSNFDAREQSFGPSRVPFYVFLDTFWDNLSAWYASGT